MDDLDKVYAQRIAEEYAPKENNNKVMRLKKLDQKVKLPAMVFAYIFGTFSALLAGAGMSMIFTDFGPEGTLGLILGIILGVIGFALCGLNDLFYQKILSARKQKYAFEITELAKDITDNK